MSGSLFSPRILVAVLAVLAALALGIVGWSVVDGLDAYTGLQVAAGALAVWIVQVGMRLRRFRGVQSSIHSYDEALFPLLLVTIGPGLSVLSFAVGATAVSLTQNKSGLKSVFNVSEFTLAAAGGALVAASIGIAPTGRGVMAVLAASAVFATLTITIFGTLMSVLSRDAWLTAVTTEARQVGRLVGVEVLVGTTAAIGLLAVPALTPIAILGVAFVLDAHRGWFQLSRDRQQLDDVLRATVSLHSSLTTDEVASRLADALYTLISADAELVRGRADPPDRGLAFPIDAESAGVHTLLVRRDAPLDPTAVAICETLARVAAVSYRMASLLEERDGQAKALREIIDEREAFLSATAHQLRTPLTAMVGFASLLWQEPDDAQVMREMMSHLVAQAGEMTHHLDNLLVSSRAVTDSVLIARADVDVRMEVERAVAALPPGRSQVPVVGEAVRAYVDPVRLRHMVRNLLVNAQTHGGRAVEARVGIDGPHVWIEVRDDGSGLSPAAERHAFSWARVQGRSSAQPGGVGLGLFVARRLARLMAGEVTYRRENDWTVFRITLPAVPGLTPTS